MDLGELHSIVARQRRLELELLDAISRLDWDRAKMPHLWQVLMESMRITRAEAKRLAHRVEMVCPSVAITGQEIAPKLPVVREAMAAGALDSDHVDRIITVVEQAPAEHADRVETELVEYAHQFTPTQVARLGQRMLDALDPDGDGPGDETVVEAQNTLNLHEHRDGSLSGTFRVGAETAAHLKPLLSSLAKPQPEDRRVLVERQGDALAEVIRIVADAGKAPAEGGERPHVAVTVSLETLQSGIGRATLEDGQSLTPEQARRLACDAGIIPIVLGSRSQPIDIGESKRLADKRLRLALAIRDKGCAMPGCGRTPHQCHAHHIQHWADGGPTTLGNMVLVCHYHHRLIHHAGWQVRMDNGLPVFTPPTWLRPAA